MNECRSDNPPRSECPADSAPPDPCAARDPVACVRRDVLGLSLLVAVWLGIGWAGYGFFMVEKILTRCLTSCGLLWVGLLVNWRLIRAYRPGWLSRWSCLVFLLYWLTHSTYTANWLARSLEQRYHAVEPATADHFDLIVVLGGGTMSDLEQAVWLGTAGDRVMLAARLYHQGKVDHLVTTGLVQAWSDARSVQLSEATERIWRDLGVPASAITRVGGHNTSEELRNVRRLLESHASSYRRVGLLTSAFHLPRAERLARKNHLDVVPIPAAFVTPVDDPFILSLVPYHYGLMMTDLALKEYLAAMIGR